jgi:hypothetical protein
MEKQLSKKEIDAYFEKYIAPTFKDPKKFLHFILGAYGELAKIEMEKKKK